MKDEDKTRAAKNIQTLECHISARLALCLNRVIVVHPSPHYLAMKQGRILSRSRSRQL